MLVERDGQTGCWQRGRGKQNVSREGGAKWMLVEVEGHAGS